MSHTTTFDVYYETIKEITVEEIIETYLSYGWSIDKFGYISLRPLGDKDDFGWVELKNDQRNQLYKIIGQKVNAGEEPAIALTWEDTDESVVFTFSPREKRINYLLMGNTTRHPDLSGFTDVNRYLVLFYEPLLAKGIDISLIKFSERV